MSGCGICGTHNGCQCPISPEAEKLLSALPRLEPPGFYTQYARSLSTNGKTMSLGTALPAEMTRVRDEIMPLYIEIGPPGAMALMLMRADLDTAAKAFAEQDTVTMIQIYEKLKGWEG